MSLASVSASAYVGRPVPDTEPGTEEKKKKYSE